MRKLHFATLALIIAVTSQASANNSDLQTCQSASEDENANQVIEACSKVLQNRSGLSDEETAATYTKRAFAHEATGNFGHAMEDYAEAIRLVPENATIYRNRGVTYLENG